MAGASDFMVGNAPGGVSYAPPLLNFAPLGDLAKDYYQGQQMQREQAAATAFPQGIPKLPNGQIDTTAILNKSAQIGGLPAIQQLLPFIQKQQLLDQDNPQPSSEASQTDSFNRGQGSTQTAGPGHLGGTGTVPANAPASGPIADNNGQDTLRSVFVESSGGKDYSAFMPRIASALGVHPDQPLNPGQVQQARSAVGNIARALTANRPTRVTNEDPSASGAPTGATSSREVGVNGSPGPSPEPARPSGRHSAASVVVPPAWKGRELEYFDSLERRGQKILQDAQRHEDVGIKADAKIKQGESFIAQAKAGREALAKDAELTIAEKDARASGTSSPLEMERRKKIAGQDVEDYGKKYTSLQTMGDRADEELENIRLSKSYVNHPDFYSGTGAKFVDAVKGIGAIFGDPYAATPNQVFDKIRSGSILNQIKGMAGTGPVRVAEMNFIEKMIASRDNSAASLRTLLGVEERVADRVKTIRNMATDYKLKYQALDAGFDKQVENYKESHPLFSDKEIKDPRHIAPPEYDNNRPPPPRGTLPPGTPIKWHGQIKYAQ